MRPLFALTLSTWATCAFAPSCDSTGARVVVDQARAVRRPDGFVDVALDLTASVQGGGDVGPFCISAHWLPAGVDTGLLEGGASYYGESDHTQLCTRGLADGDKRTLHLVSTRSDTVLGISLRAQAGIGSAIEWKDIGNP